MSELQIGLLGLGVIVVIGVLIFNKVQERRARRAAEKQFDRKHDDVLLGAREASDNAQTASLETPSATPPAPHDAFPGERVEPRWHEAAQAMVMTESPEATASADDGAAGSVLAPQSLDARIDFIAELVVEDPVLGSHVKLEVEKLPLKKNIDCDGYNETARGWEMLNRDAVYERVRIGIQLSDRGGPLKSDELAVFQSGVAAMAQQLGAGVEWPGEQSPLTRATELDAFCAGVDVLIGINVVVKAHFAETKLRGLAEANGFVREADGVFHRRDPVDEGGGEVLSMKGVEVEGALKAVSLALDVPRVARETAPFALMTHCAKRLAKGLDGKLVDDNGRALDDAGLAAIQTSLAGIYARMDAAGMPAGGALARRVFS